MEASNETGLGVDIGLGGGGGGGCRGVGTDLGGGDDCCGVVTKGLDEEEEEEEEVFTFGENEDFASGDSDMPSNRSINSSICSSSSFPSAWTGGRILLATSLVTRLSWRCSSSMAICCRFIAS